MLGGAWNGCTLTLLDIGGTAVLGRNPVTTSSNLMVFVGFFIKNGLSAGRIVSCGLLFYIFSMLEKGAIATGCILSTLLTSIASFLPDGEFYPIIASIWLNEVISTFSLFFKGTIDSVAPSKGAPVAKFFNPLNELLYEETSFLMD